MAIKRELLWVSATFNEDATYAQSAKEAVEHNLYNTDGALEWDTHLLVSEEHDNETTTEKFLLCVVYNTYDLSGTSLEDVIDTELYSEDGIISYSIDELKSEMFSADITLKEIGENYGSRS